MYTSPVLRLLFCFWSPWISFSCHLLQYPLIQRDNTATEGVICSKAPWKAWKGSCLSLWIWDDPNQRYCVINTSPTNTQLPTLLRDKNCCCQEWFSLLFLYFGQKHPCKVFGLDVQLHIFLQRILGLEIACVPSSWAPVFGLLQVLIWAQWGSEHVYLRECVCVIHLQ